MNAAVGRDRYTLASIESLRLGQWCREHQLTLFFCEHRHQPRPVPDPDVPTHPDIGQPCCGFVCDGLHNVCDDCGQSIADNREAMMMGMGLR